MTLTCKPNVKLSIVTNCIELARSLSIAHNEWPMAQSPCVAYCASYRMREHADPVCIGPCLDLAPDHHRILPTTRLAVSRMLWTLPPGSESSEDRSHGMGYRKGHLPGPGHVNKCRCLSREGERRPKAVHEIHETKDSHRLAGLVGPVSNHAQIGLPTHVSGFPREPIQLAGLLLDLESL